MRLRLTDHYLRGRLARRLLMVFVLGSLVPVLLTSVVGYWQLMHGAQSERSRALREEARESALNLLAQLQTASTELGLLDPAATAAAGSGHEVPLPFTALTFIPVGTPFERQRVLAALPERVRGPLAAGRTVLFWTRGADGRPQLVLIRPQPAASRLVRGSLDVRRLLDLVGPTEPGTGIALSESAQPYRLIESDTGPVPARIFGLLAGSVDSAAADTLWHSPDGKWRGSTWNLFLQSDFAAPPLHILICESTADAIAGLSGLRLTLPLMLLGALAFAAWLAIAQLRRYLGPLETLTTATRRLQASNFDVEVRIRTGDELADLGEDFNRMACSLRNQHSALQHQAQVDGLTGLINREYFHQKLLERLALPVRSALLYIDLDEFKNVNDSAGHEAGDLLLKEVAARLRTCLHRAEMVARLGGDEFAVLLAAGTEAGDAAAAASRILRAIQAPMMVAGTERRVSASIGIALIPADGNTADLLLRNADIAMYQAKEHGRNGMALFTPEMHRRMQERISLEVALQGAVARNELRLHYQPIMSGGKLAGLEALVRWRRPTGPEVAPGQFIPIAEQSSLIIAIGDWVLGEACADYARWRAEGIAPSYISVNVSPRQLQSSRFNARLKTLLQQRRIRPPELQLELTESAIADGAQVDATLRRLHDLGVRLALDDFGTGYSSLSQLQRLPFDVVKVDRSFIVGLPADPVALQLVRTILRMTESLGKLAVAEGVETQEQCNLLQSLGCGAMQGYLFGKPVAEEQIRELLLSASPAAQGAASADRGRVNA